MVWGMAAWMTVTATAGVVAGRQRSRGQLLQLALLLPLGALVGQWMLLQLQPQRLAPLGQPQSRAGRTRSGRPVAWVC